MWTDIKNRGNGELHKEVYLIDQITLEPFIPFHSPFVSKAGTVNIVNSIICVATALPFNGAVASGRESLVFTI